MSRYSLDASLVPLLFTTEHSSGAVYRIQADRSVKALSTLAEGRLCTSVDGERILAVDIAWALEFGNWPKYPLQQLSTNPFNCSVMRNVFPARLKRLRFRLTERNGLFYHPLSDRGYSNASHCRVDWVEYARTEYEKDLSTVLRIEAEERRLRQASGAPAPAVPVKLQSRLPKESRTRAKVTARDARTPRPAPVYGMEHHWYQGEWVTVPVACHVADDHIRRIERWLAGAVRFVYQPLAGEVWGFRVDGSVVE